MKLLISLYFFMLAKLYLTLNIYQQAHYQIKPYLKHFIHNFIFYDLFVVIVYFVSLFIDDIVTIIICNSYVIFYSLFFLFNRKKLVFTKRAIRLLIISIIFSLLGLIPYCELILIVFEFILVPVLFLEQIISLLSNKPFIDKAKLKLSNYSGRVIGITGSFGKTSSKMLFQQALSCYESTLATPKSFNTPLGTSKFINDNVIEFYENIILEFGVSKPNDMDELNDFTKLDVAMITEIGYMHIDGFGNIENVLREKLKIINSLKEDGVLILNYDCKYLRECDVKWNNIISYGFEYGRFKAKNVNNLSFDFYDEDIYIDTFRVNLVGKHQILNLLGIISYCYYIGLDLEKIKRACLGFKLEKNRLELKQYNNRWILDDSFNSNYKGFVSALDILKHSEGKHILLTPGMVELGKYHKELMIGLTSFIVDSCDIVILIGYKQTKGLYYRLKEYPIEVYLVRNFMEGYRLYLTIANYNKSSTLLIENDLPDIYRVGLFC